MRDLLNLFKLRIGVAIAVTALTGLAVERGDAPALWQAAILVLAVLVSSAAAGAFNQYVERDLDALMARTRNRPFVTGAFRHTPAWLWLIGVMTGASVLGASVATNAVAALHVFLGAFTYGVVYTVWLKRRTAWNVVVGGLAGSFAVLAGAAAVTPVPGPEVLALAAVLFLWTPPHFWGLAMACRDDYTAAGVPMLTAVVSEARAAGTIFVGAVVLVAVSLLPAAFGLGGFYLGSALAGGGWYLHKCRSLLERPGREAARASFRASLVQLCAVLLGAMIDVAMR